MTRPWIEPRAPGPLANTLLIRPMNGKKIKTIQSPYAKHKLYFFYSRLALLDIATTANYATGRQLID